MKAPTTTLLGPKRLWIIIVNIIIIIIVVVVVVVAVVIITVLPPQRLNCQHGSDSRRERGNLKPQTTIVMHAPEAAGLNLAVAYPHPLGPSEHDLCHRAARK